MRISSVLVVLLLVSACGKSDPESRATKPQGQEVDARARVLLDEARKALGAGDLEAASKHLNQVEQYHRDLPESNFLRGHISLQLNDLAEAQEAFKRVLDRFPNYEAAAHAMGDVAHHSGQYREALKWYHREDRLKPTRETWLNIGNTHLALEEPDSARIAYTRALNLSPQYAPAHYALARLSEDLGDFQLALEHARTAIEIDPGNDDYQYAAGSALLNLGKLEEARIVLDAVVARRPWDYSALYSLALTLQRLGRSEDASRMMQRADEARTREAELRASRRTARAYRDSLDAQIALAERLVKSGRIDEAIAAYNVALLLDPDDLVLRQNIAGLYLHKGEVQESISRASAILAEDSTHVPAWVILSAAYARKGDLTRSEQAWRRALSINPNHPSILQVAREMN